MDLALLGLVIIALMILFYMHWRLQQEHLALMEKADIAIQRSDVAATEMRMLTETFGRYVDMLEHK